MTEPKVEVQAPALPNVFRGNVGNVIFSVGVLMFAAFIGSAYLLAAHRATYPVASVVLSAIWVVGVPLYFFFEHVYLFRKYSATAIVASRFVSMCMDWMQLVSQISHTLPQYSFTAAASQFSRNQLSRRRPGLWPDTESIALEKTVPGRSIASRTHPSFS